MNGEKSLVVSPSILQRLVALKKANGFKSLSQVVSYLLDLLDPEHEAANEHIARQREYQRVLDVCQKIRELLEQPIQVTVKPVEFSPDFPPLRPLPPGYERK